MKKLLLSAALILTFGSYVFAQKFNFGDDEGRTVTPPPGISLGANTATDTATSSGNNPVAAQNPPAAKPRGQYRNGQYVGPVTDAFYGNVQVAVTIQNGQIADVKFLQYPSDRTTSREINGQAMPYLRAEALQAQSARVDGVSGATATSDAFRQSLSSALVQAKA